MKQTNMMKLIGVVGVTTATAFIGAGEAKAASFALDLFDQATIDDDDSSEGLEVTGQGSDTGSQTNVNSFNFDRNETLTTSESVSGTTTSDIDAGELDVRVASSQFATSTLSYTGFSDFDLTQSGSNDRVLFETDDASTVGFNAEVAVTFGDGTNSETVTKQFSGSRPASLEFLFSEFSGVDFQSIDTISYDIGNTTDGVNYRLDEAVLVTSAEAVPFEAETSVAFAFLGAFGAWKYWKRRKQQQVSFDDN